MSIFGRFVELNQEGIIHTMNRTTQFIVALLVSIFFIGILPATTLAAELYLQPSSKEVYYGDVFVVDLRLNSQGECINAIDAKVVYDVNRLDTVDIGRGQSIMSLWIEEPAVDHTRGVISLVGGIPGGYCGRVVGDPGQSDLIARLVFSTTGNQITEQPGATTTVAVLPSSTALLSDGLGTEAELTTKNTTVTIGGSRGFINNEWLSEIERDATPPEPFNVRLSQNNSVADGKYYITFSTTDKQSGIDHFEVFESSLERGGYVVGTDRPAQWRRISGTEQYYVLQDQTLKSKVIVKAIDKAGNEQLAELTWEDRSLFGDSRLLNYIFFGSILLGIVIVTFGLVMYLRRGRIRRSDELYEHQDHGQI